MTSASRSSPPAAATRRWRRRLAAALGVLGVSIGTASSRGVGVLAQTASGPAIDQLIARMTLDEKIAMLHGATDPEPLGQAGYLPGVPRLGIPPLRLTDGPAGVRTSKPATALPAPVALASTFSPELARQYGQVIARDGRAHRQNVILAPMVNIVRVPQGGRNFETLGEDPFLASRMVAAEVEGIQRSGLIATVKHFALNNQENARNAVSADADERTMHEIELPGFEAAIRAGAGSVMAAYNKVNGTWSAESVPLLTGVLRDEWKFTGFVMSDWGATHSGAPALTAGMEMEMPSGRNYATLAEAVKGGQLPERVVNTAVKRILTAMSDVGLLAPGAAARPAGTIPDVTPSARDIAIAGAVLLKNRGNVLPINKNATDTVAVIGPTAMALLVGGGGSARVPPMHTGKPFDAIHKWAPLIPLTYAVGYDVDGVTVPASALSLEGAKKATIDFIDSDALAAGSTTEWRGSITAPVTGDYVLELQTAGGRGTLAIDPPPPAPAGAAPVGGAPAGRGAGRGGGGGRGGGLLPTAEGLSATSTPVHWDAGSKHTVVVTGTANATTPLQIRLAWLTPGSSDARIEEAVKTAKAAKTVVLFAYDEGQEGRDRASLSLPGTQDALIQAVTAANSRTIVVLNNGAPILMPWANQAAAILQMWYPGQEGADATAALLTGDASPGGRLPVTFPKRAEDAPTAMPERYPGVDGHGAYSEGIFVGYRWYDQQKIEPLFPFGHGLSYAEFEYSGLTVKPASDGVDVSFTVKNKSAREASDVPQLYLGPPAAPAVPMAARALVGFQRVLLRGGQSQVVTLHVGARELSYWNASTHAWTLAPGSRALMLGASSRDIRLEQKLSVKAR